MDDYLIKEVIETHKDDETGAIFYRVDLKMRDKADENGPVLCSGSAEGDDKKATMIAARTSWVHALAVFWKVDKKDEQPVAPVATPA